jgi:hypothetical protein
MPSKILIALGLAAALLSGPASAYTWFDRPLPAFWCDHGSEYTCDQQRAARAIVELLWCCSDDAIAANEAAKRIARSKIPGQPHETPMREGE